MEGGLRERPEAPAESKGGREDCRAVTEVQGGGPRGNDRGMAGARPHRGREPSASSEFRLSLPGLGPRSGRGGLRAHFLTRLRVALKGQLSGRASGPPAASKSAHLRQAGARRHECTCVHGPALFWDSPEAREGVAGARASPSFWKGSATPSTILSHCLFP